MRVSALLVSFLLFTTGAFAQQATAPRPAKSAPLLQAATESVGQPPLHPVTPEQVHELLELTGANRLKNQVMRGMWINLQKAFPPFVPKDVLNDLEASLERADLEPILISAYQKRVSTEDAAQAIAFYRTPAGQRLIRALPQITQEMQAAGAKLGMQVTQDVLARHRDEIKAAAAKYREDHADTPKITEPN